MRASLRAALCAVVTRYRARGALRDAGKALGLTEDVIAALNSQVSHWSCTTVDEAQIAELGFNAGDRRLRLALDGFRPYSAPSPAGRQARSTPSATPTTRWAA